MDRLVLYIVCTQKNEKKKSNRDAVNVVMPLGSWSKTGTMEHVRSYLDWVDKRFAWSLLLSLKKRE